MNRTADRARFSVAQILCKHSRRLILLLMLFLEFKCFYFLPEHCYLPVEFGLFLLVFFYGFNNFVKTAHIFGICFVLLAQFLCLFKHSLRLTVCFVERVNIVHRKILLYFFQLVRGCFIFFGYRKQKAVFFVTL